MSVPIIKRLLPKGRAYGRPGYGMTPTSITIHNTSNEQVGADAEAHANFLEAGRGYSWHFSSDHDSIVQHLPTNEQGWHTGTNAGNTTSIGIEVCEYPNTADGRAKQAKATDNAAWLAAKLTRENPSIKRVVTHKSWSGKNCPRDILTNWYGFLALVKSHQSATAEVDDMAAKNVLIQAFVRPDKVKAAVAALEAQGLRVYEVDSDDARITRKNPAGSAQ